MTNYDLNVILDPNLSESQVQNEKDAIAAQVERAEGTIVELDEWGNRRLAYPIRKLDQGYYLIYRLELSGEKSQTLLANLKLRDNVMRVLMTRERPEHFTKKAKSREKREQASEQPAAS